MAANCIMAALVVSVSGSKLQHGSISCEGQWQQTAVCIADKTEAQNTVNQYLVFIVALCILKSM